MSQATYRIVPLSIIRYAIEVMQPDKAARILLTCPTEDAAKCLDDRNEASVRRTTSPRLSGRRPTKLDFEVSVAAATRGGLLVWRG
jgi:hypothetical protein